MQLDADEPDDSDESLEASADVPDEDAPDGSPEARIAKLEAELKAAREEAQSLKEWEEYAAEWQRTQQEQHAKNYWANAEAEAQRWYQSRKAQIFREAEDAVAPIAYLNQQMGMLDSQWRQWLDYFHSQREQAYYEFAVQQSMPNMAADVAEAYGLGKDAINDIMQYPMELWDREAARMKRERDANAKLKKQATQAARKAEREKLLRSGTFTGDGGAGGKVDAELGSEDHYMSIPWQVVGPR